MIARSGVAGPSADGRPRQLEVLERAGLRRLIDAMACPVEEPRSAGAKALLGPPGLLRLRVAAYRMLYEVHDGRLLVLVLTPGHRPDAHHQR